MAITYRASFAGGGTSSTSDRTITFTPAANDLLVVFVSLSGNTQAAPGCSDDQGGTYALIKQALWNASANNMVCYVRNQLVASAVQHIITIDTDTNTAGEIVVIACAGSRRVGSNAVRSSGSQANQASGSTPAPVLNQAALTGNMTLSAVGGGDTTTDIATNWTERQDVSQSTPTTALAVMTRDSGFTGTTITYNSTEGAVYASMALELDGSIPPLTADQGSFTETGQAITPAVGMPAAQASFTETGQAVTLGVAMPAAFGSFAESGQDIVPAVAMPAAFGSFALAGQDVTLTYTPSSGSTMTADYGAFTFTGQAATLAVSMPAAFGSFAEAGQDVTFATALPAAFGSFALAGQAITPAVAMPAAFGSFALAGQDVGLTKQSKLVAAFGGFVESGLAALVGRRYRDAGGLRGLRARCRLRNLPRWGASNRRRTRVVRARRPERHV